MHAAWVGFLGVLVPASIVWPLGIASAQETALFVTGSGTVGVGTAAPGADLEVADVDGNGFTGFRLNNTQSTGSGRTWLFSAAPNGSYQLSLLGSGGGETNFNARLDGDGKSTLVVQGSVDATNFNMTSSRQLKTDFERVDGKDLLAKLEQIPVGTWRYRHDPENVRHYGPVAEDFHAAFGVGDGRHISAVDANGVAMAAIQTLHGMVAEKERQIDELRRELRKLQEKVQALSPSRVDTPMNTVEFATVEEDIR